ncbi:unnamed protein product [Aureobasidium pullulans]|nr:unnamed protein product [Aureobasidium pullulans]
MEAIRVEMQHMAEAIDELEEIQTESPKKSQDDITLRFHFVKESLEKITKTTIRLSRSWKRPQIILSRWPTILSRLPFKRPSNW